jgi:hypothetical protein
MLAPLALVAAALLGAADPPAPAPMLDARGFPRDPNVFPIAVWLQSPRNAARYKAAGINLYVGLYRGPNAEQLEILRQAGMPVICDLNKFAGEHKNDPTFAGWMHGDEPDNAQPERDPKTGRQRYGPPIPPAKIVEDYKELKAADPSRPVLLNLGQGVANDAWKGRGAGASLDDYPKYVQGGDVISFDVYPVAGLGRDDGADFLWYVAKGVDRLMTWTKGGRVVWNCVECTRISHEGGHKATPAQVKAEVWMALVHGSRGLIYFVHEFKPKFNEHALLDDPEMLAGVTAINREVQALAPVLNSPTIANGATVSNDNKTNTVAAMVKRHEGATYVFAVGMRNGPARATFTLKDLPPDAEVEVLGESRRVPITRGAFVDDFAPYAVHLYRIAPPR